MLKSLRLSLRRTGILPVRRARHPIRHSLRPAKGGAEYGAGHLRRVGVRDKFCTEVEPYFEPLRSHGIDAAGIEAAARELLAP